MTHLFISISKLILSVLFILTTCLPFVACAGGAMQSDEVKVDTVLTVAIFNVTEVDGVFTSVQPPLITDTVSVSRLIHYPGYGDSITVPFQFNDTVCYADITRSNINRRIAIAVDGNVVATPMVKMQIDNGACSFMLSRQQAERLFSKSAIDQLLPICTN